jgi:hypothetical protein
MEYKTEVLMSLPGILQSAIMSVDHMMSHDASEIQLMIKLNASVMHSNRSMLGVMKARLQMVGSRGMEPHLVNLSGSLLYWDIVVVCGRMVGRCTKMHIRLNPTAQMTFSHETEPALSVSESVKVLDETFRKMVSLKNSLAGKSCMAGPECNEAAIGMGPREMESPSRTVTIPVPRELDTERQAGLNRESVPELERCMTQGARLQMSMAGLQTTVTANLMLMSAEMNNSTMGGGRAARRPIETMRMKLREVAVALQELELHYDVLQSKLRQSASESRETTSQREGLPTATVLNQPELATQTPLLAALLVTPVAKARSPVKRRQRRKNATKRRATSTVTRPEDARRESAPESKKASDTLAELESSIETKVIDDAVFTGGSVEQKSNSNMIGQVVAPQITIGSDITTPDWQVAMNDAMEMAREEEKAQRGGPIPDEGWMPFKDSAVLNVASPTQDSDNQEDFETWLASLSSTLSGITRTDTEKSKAPVLEQSEQAGTDKIKEPTHSFSEESGPLDYLKAESVSPEAFGKVGATAEETSDVLATLRRNADQGLLLFTSSESSQ